MYIEHMMRQNYVSKGTTNKQVQLKLSPHYYHDAKQFEKPKTVFCSEPENLVADEFGYYKVPSCNYEYLDRLYVLDIEKYTESCNVANQADCTKYSAEWCEVLLSHYFEKEVELVHIIAGINHSNGSSYCIFGFKK